MATQAPFPVNGELTAVAVSYRNRALIADLVLPRVPVMQSEFKYMKYDKDSGFTIPDTKIGRKSEANIVETGGVEVTDSTVDYALKDVVPMTDLANAPDGYDPKARATEFTTNLLDLAREVRAANLVFSTAQYGTANKATLSGTSQWSDTTSDPIRAILGAMDSMLLPPRCSPWVAPYGPNCAPTPRWWRRCSATAAPRAQSRARRWPKCSSSTTSWWASPS